MDVEIKANPGVMPDAEMADNPVEDITSTAEGKRIEEEINIDCNIPSATVINGIDATAPKEDRNEVSDSDTIPECDSDENIVIVMNENSKYNARVKPDESTYTNFCSKCDAVFRWPYQLKNHISVAHEGKYPYSCKQCGKQFEHLKSFRDHKYVHTEERPYACELCPSRFKMRGGLNKHMRDIHVDNKVQFKCEYCGKTFRCKEKLMNHFVVHNEEKAFACDVCGKKFSRKTNMKEHRVTHSLEKDFECKECGMKFNRKYAMKIHMRNHLAVRPYKCEFCDKSFSQSHALKSHTRLHTGERPYQCQYCERSFKQLGTLQVHTKRHLNEKNFKCGICDRAFIVQRRLNEHMRVHTGEKPYQCEFCPFRAATSTGLRCHKNTHERRLKRHMEEQSAANGPVVLAPKSIEEVIKKKMKPRLKPKKKPVSTENDHAINNGEIDQSVNPSKVTVKSEINETGDNQKDEKAVKVPVKKKRSPIKKKFKTSTEPAQIKNQSLLNNGTAGSLGLMLKRPPSNVDYKPKSNGKKCLDVKNNSTRNIENIFVGGLNLCDMKDAKYTTIRETRMFPDGVRRTIERKVRTSSLPNGNRNPRFAMSDRVVVIDSDSDSNSKDKTNYFKALNADQTFNHTQNQIASVGFHQHRNLVLAPSGKSKEEIYMEKVFANALLGGSDRLMPSSLDNGIMMQNLMNDNSNVINKAIENLANSITRAYYSDSDNEAFQNVSKNKPATTMIKATNRELSSNIQDHLIEIDYDNDELNGEAKPFLDTRNTDELNTHVKTDVNLDTESKSDGNITTGNDQTGITNDIVGVNNDINSAIEKGGDENTINRTDHTCVKNDILDVNGSNSTMEFNSNTNVANSSDNNAALNNMNSVSNDLNGVTYDLVQMCNDDPWNSSRIKQDFMVLQNKRSEMEDDNQQMNIIGLSSSTIPNP